MFFSSLLYRFSDETEMMFLYIYIITTYTHARMQIHAKYDTYDRSSYNRIFFLSSAEFFFRVHFSIFIFFHFFISL